MKNKKLSLVKLIQHFFPEIKDSKIFTSSEHRVMFIFDGLDECRLPLDFHSKLSCCDVTEPVLVNVLLTNLVKRNLLPSALLWITTRPAAASQIPPECVDQVTEIRGFNDPQKEEYFRKRVRDENLANRTITHLKSSRSLYIMCHIPVFCWISATVVERTSFESENIEMPRTLTQMYTHFLIIQTSLKKAKYTERKETDEEIIFKLGKLAFQQLKEGNLIFYEEDLGECDINVTEASVYSGVCTQIFREESGVYQGKVFSFVHLSIQEFLAALYVFLCFENRERSMTDQHQTSQLSALFRAATLHDLHKTAVDLALQSENGHLDLFLRFLLGLSLESNQNLLMHLLPQTISHKQSSEQTVQYIKQKIRDQSNSGRRINLFYCLNELNHHSVVEKIDRSSGTLFVDTLIPGEWETRRFTFKIPEEQLDEFDLQKYIKTPETDQTELLSPDEVLQRLVPVVTSALLYECSLTEKSCAAIASAARPNSCSLKELNLSDNDLHDAGVQHLSDLLKNPHCKLEKLELSWCSLTENSCAAIASAARSNSCSLKELDLSHNDLHDAGVQHLSELLKNPHCKLEKLVLVNCSLTEKSCAAIASAARSNSCSLKELNLSHNKLHDAGVQHLSELLKNPHCKLETLELVQCLLTEKSCAVIASAARSNSCSLKELNLRGNELHDAGVQHLSELLKNPHCKLETLELSDCFLTEKSCAVIASAARSNSCSLKELNLNRNELHDAGVQHLSELLKNPHCKLEKLELSDCFLTEKSCAVIASAARSNSCSLKELNLSHNELHDAGVQHLSELLKNPHCKLETLVLQYCSLTEKSCAVIASAARSNSCSLKELNLSHNELHDAGVQHLSELLKNPHCKLETLVLQYCSLTEKSCAVIASAARSNSCSLKELNLSHNELHDAGVQHLSELLKNPHCKLEKLQLVNCFLTEKSCAAIASAARSNSCSLKELNLSHNELHDAGVQHLSELLKNPHCKLETLVLSDCFLTEKSCAVIASAARSNSCSLKELNLRGNELHDAGVQHLSELLKNPHCKLEKLELSDCFLTEKSCAAIASAAGSNSCSLKELNLSDNELHDAGVQHLSELLKNPHCKLETLVLSDCFLTEKSCAVIASAARSNSCSLKELNLSHNELHDAGVQHLSELLKNPHCKLETLVAHSPHTPRLPLIWLMSCSLTDKSCAAIASAAGSNSCSLKELNLSENELHDAGVQHLSELLKNPHCKLETLVVDVGIFLKESPAAAAASASSSHSDAAELHLRDKVQQDPGAQLLSLDTHVEDHHSDAPQRSCEFCAEVPDSSHWVLLKPEVSTDESVSTYSLSSPAGSYECSESGLRWTCDGPVTLQYRFTDWHVFAEELAHMQSRPAGPLMDIRVMSGELEEIHLPHYLCLGGFEASVGDAVRVLHGRESGVCVEVCELTRHHARLLHPSFSLLGLVYYLRDLFSPKVHCELLLFCTCTAPLVLQAYLVPTYPNDPAHIRAILQKDVEKEKTGVWIDKPRVLGSLREMDTFCVRTSCPSEIQPEKMNLWPLSTGNFCEVYMEQPEKEFDMEVISSQQPIWTVKIRRRDYCKPSRSPGQGSSQGTNTERLAQVRPGLIRGVSRGVLRSTLDRLQAHRPPVLSSREAEEVLQRSQVLQDQVSCLVDMVHRKGDTACSIMLVLLEELDPHLHGELHL
ncbi:NLR family CARD domain-containing protein 3-like isoform X9 [Alosa sapidissima]|uniref:NLR family CARD domain-containing protein 3-like isoform X9 n=1 Tax=Alosa sapidissima TaxID=34773 RepID=UPI001C098938|nr:NLR family CARD domain-containing protein 3-like isoform X9 [Alosa sapidissima]